MGWMISWIQVLKEKKKLYLSNTEQYYIYNNIWPEGFGWHRMLSLSLLFLQSEISIPLNEYNSTLQEIIILFSYK